MKPRIAITVAPEEAASPKWGTYTRAIENAGGEPHLVYGDFAPERIEGLLAQFDGLLLPGGLDVDPEIYGGRRHPSVQMNAPARDSLELEAARAARRTGLPTLGICRGFQVMTVALGGTLYEHLPDRLDDGGSAIHHRQTEQGHARGDRTHPIDVTAGSKLAAIVGGPCVDTNSLHHQGARRVPYDLLVVGRSRDGLAEAVELREPHPFYVGVQWHPEETVANDEPSRNIFRAFVRAAAERAVRRGESAESTQDQTRV